ncbi:MAG: T9SS type A sorting domain-containing protein [Bacteroidota bacterium]
MQPFHLAATSSSGLPVVYSSNNPNVATINDNTITIVGAGKALITASQPGNGHFLAAQNVVRELVVNKKSQTIVFDPLPQRPLDSFLLNAKASSELTVIFTSDNANVASIAGNTITVRGVGSAVISASQSGDATYEPALTVSQALVVQVITAVEDARGRMSSVYPNPSRGVVNIYNPALQGIKEIQVIVIGLAGNTQQVMQPQQVAEDHFQLDMSDLPSGMYMLRINGSDNVLKVVKQ